VTSATPAFRNSAVNTAGCSGDRHGETSKAGKALRPQRFMNRRIVLLPRAMVAVSQVEHRIDSQSESVGDPVRKDPGEKSCSLPWRRAELPAISMCAYLSQFGTEPKVPRPGTLPASFKFEQMCLGIQSPCEAGELAQEADYAMARYKDR
jgi:hypothetical protein